MNRERLKELWSRFLAGPGLSLEEERELRKALEDDETLRAAFLEDARTDGVLRALGKNQEGHLFVQALLDCLEAERDAVPFVAKVQSRLDKEGELPPGGGAGAEISGDRRKTGKPVRYATGRRVGMGRRNRSSLVSWFAVLAAAGVFIGIIVLFSLSDSGSDRPVPEKNRAVRADKVPWSGVEPAPEEVPPAVIEKEKASDRRPEGKQPSGDVPELHRSIPVPKAEEKVRPRATSPDEQRKLRIEKKMEAAVKRARKEKVEKIPPRNLPEPQAPKPKVPPARPKEKEQPKKDQGTRAALAKVEKVEGQVFVVTRSGKSPARPGQELLSGQRMTVGEESSAGVGFPDGTKLELGAGTEIQGIQTNGGKKIIVNRGTLLADVTQQPPGQPMVFVTPHGEATVLGTTLRIVVDFLDPKTGSTRLEVEKGKVRLKREIDEKAVMVMSGHYAIAAAGVRLVAKRIVNLVANPGFENASGGWRSGTAAASRGISIVPTEAHTGARALRLDPGAATVVETFQQLAVAGGERYRASAWMKIENAGGIALTLTWFDARGGSLRRDGVGGAFQGRTQAWTRLQGTYTAPPGARSVRFRLFSDGGTGLAWFDDCELVHLRRR